MKKATHLAVPFVLAASLVACGGGDSDDEATGGSGEGGGEEYVLGFSTDLSGAFAGLGRPILAGTRAYFEQVNADGGIDGHPVRLEVLDDRLDVQTGQSNIRSFADKGMPVVLGNVSSVVWATTAPLAEELEVPQIAGGAVDEFVYPPQPYLYRYLMSAKQAADGMTSFVLEQAESEDPAIALLRYESAGTDGWAKAMEENLGTLGLEPATVEQFPADATDVAPAASAVAASNPDWVLAVLTDNQAPLVVEALRNRGYTGPIVNWVGISEPTVAAVDDPEFYVIRDTVPPQHEAGADLMAAAEAAGEAENMTHDYATNGYLAAKAVGEALAECGYPCSGADLNDALGTLGEIDTEGLAGPGWTVNDDTHLFTGTVSIWRKAEGEEMSTMVGDWFEPVVDGGD